MNAMRKHQLVPWYKIIAVLRFSIMAKESSYRRNEGFVHFKILKKEAKKKKIWYRSINSEDT